MRLILIFCLMSPREVLRDCCLRTGTKEDWAGPYQDHIADLRRTAVLAAATGLIAHGKAYEAARALEPVADARATDEEVHRALMVAYDASLTSRWCLRDARCRGGPLSAA
jgi:hypothetical protein